MTTPPRDRALLALAVILMLGGAVTLVGGWIAAGIAIPLIAIGIAIVVIEQACHRIGRLSLTKRSHPVLRLRMQSARRAFIRACGTPLK